MTSFFYVTFISLYVYFLLQYKFHISVISLSLDIQDTVGKTTVGY